MFCCKEILQSLLLPPNTECTIKAGCTHLSHGFHNVGVSISYRDQWICEPAKHGTTFHETKRTQATDDKSCISPQKLGGPAFIVTDLPRQIDLPQFVEQSRHFNFVCCLTSDQVPLFYPEESLNNLLTDLVFCCRHNQLFQRPWFPGNSVRTCNDEIIKLRTQNQKHLKILGRVRWWCRNQLDIRESNITVNTRFCLEITENVGRGTSSSPISFFFFDLFFFCKEKGIAVFLPCFAPSVQQYYLAQTQHFSLSGEFLFHLIMSSINSFFVSWFPLDSWYVFELCTSYRTQPKHLNDQ